MIDTLSPEQRSQLMAKIHGKDTAIEKKYGLISIKGGIKSFADSRSLIFQAGTATLARFRARFPHRYNNSPARAIVIL